MKIDGNVIELRGAETSIDVDAPLRIKDGASFVDVRNYIAPVFQYENLVVKNNTGTPNSQIDVSWDSLYIGPIHSTTYTQTLNIESDTDWDSGDHTDEPANGWVYIHAFAKADGAEVCKFSLSATAPTPPADYLYSRLIASPRNTSGNFVPFYQQDDVVQKSVAALFTAITTTDSGTSRDISAYVPANVKGVFCQLIVDSNVSNTYFSGNASLTGLNNVVLSISMGGSYSTAYRFVTNGIVYLKSPVITTYISMATGTFSMTGTSSGYIIKI